jgi:hypothetical protein
MSFTALSVVSYILFPVISMIDIVTSDEEARLIDAVKIPLDGLG